MAVGGVSGGGVSANAYVPRRQPARSVRIRQNRPGVIVLKVILMVLWLSVVCWL
jgi:hypothetical protein